MSGLRSKIAISNPFTRPITIAHTNTMKIAYARRSSDRLGDTDEDVGEQRDRTRHREVDPAHHDHEHLPEGDDGDDAADRQEDRPGRRRQRRRRDDLTDEQEQGAGDPDGDEAGAEQQVAHHVPETEAAGGSGKSAGTRNADVFVGQLEPPLAHGAPAYWFRQRCGRRRAPRIVYDLATKCQGRHASPTVRRPRNRCPSGTALTDRIGCCELIGRSARRVSVSGRSDRISSVARRERGGIQPT